VLLRGTTVISGPIDEPVAVVPFTSPIRAAVALEAGLVTCVAEGEVRRRGEVVDGVRRGRQDLARRQGALVGLEVACRVGQVERVVPDLGGSWVAVGVEVEVGVLGQQEGWFW
jgi:hypothetical protein